MSTLAPLPESPKTQAELLAQAQRLAGYSLGELAAMAGIVSPIFTSVSILADWLPLVSDGP